MIVKNESTTIQRCLSSVRELIDYWVIVDTGSIDETQRIIQEFLQDVPGELHEHEWVNFEQNRNSALKLARNKCDYILFLDADDTLEVSATFDKNALDKDCYLILCRDVVVDSYRLLLINNDPGWQWVGILHEELQIPHAVNGGVLVDVVKNGLMRDGCRARDPERYLKDAWMLEKIYHRDKKNSRAVFFIAQSYLAAQKLELALQYFKLRVSMGGYEDEIFWSLYTIGCIGEDLKWDAHEIIAHYKKAHEFDSSRAEPLCALSRVFLKFNRYSDAYLAAQSAVVKPFPKTLFYVQRDVYEYLSLLYVSYCQHLLQMFDEAANSYEQILKRPSVPESIQQTVKIVLQRCLKKQTIQVKEGLNNSSF